MQIFKSALTENTERPQKLYALNLIRVICAIGIVVYHVSCHVSAPEHKYFLSYANGGYGELFVGIFLLISGGVLYYNHPKIDSLKAFYFKRWKAIFPMFYITWFYYYIDSAISERSVFYKGIPAMFLSIFGIDGYFSYKLDTYYKVGEWFFGALVFMYLLYPLFAFIVRKIDLLALLIIVPLWIWQINTDFFIIPDTINLIYCSLLFITGMLIFKYRIFDNIIVKIVSCILSIVLLFVPLNVNVLYTNCLAVFAMFFSMYFIGDLLLRFKLLTRLLSFMGNYTFPVYLLQNSVTFMAVYYLKPESFKAFLFTAILVLCICALHSWYLTAIVKAVYNTKWFKKIEEFFMRKKIKEK